MVVFPAGVPDPPGLLLVGSPRGVSDGVVMVDASLNRVQVYSDTGSFNAPVDGLYLFMLVLDLKPGAAHISLWRSSGAARTLLRQRGATAGPVTTTTFLQLREGEELRLELRGGEWAESPINVFAVVLLQRDT